MARRVVAQASFSWPFGPIHLLAPYGAVSHTKGWAADLTGPLRQRLTALPPPLEGEAGWVMQTASVVTRTRGILRRCAPQDDKGERAPRNDWLICHSERNNVERRISRLRGSIPHPSLRGGSVLPESQSKAGGTGAHCAPLRGGTSPLHAATAGGWQSFCGTTPLRAQRVLKGKGLIRKKGKTAGVPLLVRSAAAQAAFPPAMCGQFHNAF